MVTINPALFVRPPYLACPRCGKRSFGVLGVGRDRTSAFVRRGCPTCRVSEQSQLPVVTKRVLYVDQFAVSNMLRAAHPDHRREGHHSDFYRRLLVQLVRLVQLQAIVCPQSSTHEEESALDGRIEPDLLALLRRLSAGVRFAHRHTIENSQTVATALAWHVGQQVAIDRSDRSSAFMTLHRTVNAWMPHLTIAFNQRWSPLDVKIMRWTKEDTVREWKPIFERWRKNPLDVMERFREEGRGFGRSVLTLFAAREQRIEATKDLPFFQSPDDIAARVMCPASHVTIALTKTAGLEPEPAMKRMVEFFRSDAVLEIPFSRIRSMLYASLSRETQNGRKGPTKRDGSTPADFGAISTSLPYCTAMFVDNKCAEYLGQQPLAPEVAKFACRIFSVRSGENFLRYLAELEALVPQQQRQLVEDVYGSLPTEVQHVFGRV